jgi:hypothetical protein
LDNKAEEIYEVDIMKDGREALERTNIEMGNFQIYNTVDPFLSDHPYFFCNFDLNQIIRSWKFVVNVIIIVGFAL